jgi:hypothetical protein
MKWQIYEKHSNHNNPRKIKFVFNVFVFQQIKFFLFSNDEKMNSLKWNKCIPNNYRNLVKKTTNRSKNYNPVSKNSKNGMKITKVLFPSLTYFLIFCFLFIEDELRKSMEVQKEVVCLSNSLN